MKAIRTVLACLRRADQTYNLINHGDKIIIGLSGGKDSIALTYALSLYRKFSHTDFTIQPVTLDLGFPGFNPAPLKEFCESLGLTLIVSDNTSVYPILQKQQGDNKHLPCSICSRMKKAAINKVAKELGFNKVAFAHHAEDAIETLFMNEIYGAKNGTFSPKMHLERADVEFIRPLLLVRESDIKSLVREEHLPVSDSHCPADKTTTREDIKILLGNIYKEFPTAKENFLTMLSNYSQVDLWGKEISLQVNQDGLNLRPVITSEQALIMMNIRHEVFIQEQNIQYEDEFIMEEEKFAHNYLIYLGEEPIGFIRYLQDDRTFTIGRFCLLKDYRGKGYGKQSFAYLVDLLTAKFTPCVMQVHAQSYLVDFYTKLGFIPEGEPFIEAGISHQGMKKMC